MTVLQAWPGMPFVSVLQKNLRRRGYSLPVPDTPASSPAPSAHLVSDGLLQELLPSAQRHLVEERSDGGAVETTCAQTHVSTGAGQDVWESCPLESWEQGQLSSGRSESWENLPEVKVKPSSGSGHSQGAAAWVA